MASPVLARVLNVSSPSFATMSWKLRGLCTYAKRVAELREPLVRSPTQLVPWSPSSHCQVPARRGYNSGRYPQGGEAGVFTRRACSPSCSRERYYTRSFTPRFITPFHLFSFSSFTFDTRSPEKVRDGEFGYFVGTLFVSICACSLYHRAVRYSREVTSTRFRAHGKQSAA